MYGYDMVIMGSKLRDAVFEEHDMYKRHVYQFIRTINIDNRNIEHEPKIMYQNIYRIEQQVLQQPIHTYNITFYLNTAHARNYKLDYTQLR